MTLNIPDAPLRRTFSVWLAAVTAVVIAAAVLAMSPTRAQAVASPVGLGTAASFGVLAGSTVTNTGPTVVNGLNVGVSPKTAITGFQTSDGGPGRVTLPGVLHSADAVAGQAKADLNTAYNQAAGQTLTDAVYITPHEFGGQTLTPGLYKANSSARITDTLTLDARGNSNAVWVFQIGSTLTTASASSVSFINGASPCNVYWQVGSSATLGTNSTFVGTIMAHTSITATTGATINGRLLAGAGPSGDGAVTLDSNTIGLSDCGSGSPGETTGTTPGETTGTTPGETTGTTPGETTGTTPGETTGTTPGETTGTTPGETTGTTPGETTGTTPGETTGTTPGETTGTTPGETTGTTPGETTGTTPGETTGTTPGETTGEAPGETTGEAPGETTGGHDHDCKPDKHNGYGDSGYGGKDDGYGCDAA
ncbi:ice-binding family protein [Streptomyces sp. NBC_00009]|uniref:ice-binding family protein n=1 Tax=Streptomyces sp. NBC_00009 TaxID=2975620 RepID=UPI003252A285